MMLSIQEIADHCTALGLNVYFDKSESACMFIENDDKKKTFVTASDLVFVILEQLVEKHAAAMTVGDGIHA